MHTALRSLFLISLIAGVLLLPVTVAVHTTPIAQAQSDGSTDGRTVYLLTFEGAVTPVLDKYIKDSIRAAIENDAEAIILQLDTPGGSVDITKSITQEMLASPVPVIIYVAPSGARAGSAGTFITLAGHVAAMAPGSSIGAASPVDVSGADVGETMEAKIENILSADIENLAARRGEAAVEWAVAAVVDAEAATADRALELGVIDIIARDVPDLLNQLDGFSVSVRGEERTLQTAGAFITELELNPLQQFLNLIANPTIATLLITIGSAGLLAEVWNPGTWIPGTIGLVCLLLGLYALGQLEANLAGLGLIALAIILLISETFTPTFGALTLAGVICFILGSVLLFDSPGIAIPWPAILTLAGGLGAFSFFAGSKALAAQTRPARTGGEGLIGQRARARNAFKAGEQGHVFVAGEWWNAQLENDSVDAGDDVQIVGRRGYTLLVKRIAST